MPKALDSAHSNRNTIKGVKNMGGYGASVGTGVAGAAVMPMAIGAGSDVLLVAAGVAVIAAAWSGLRRLFRTDASQRP